MQYIKQASKFKLLTISLFLALFAMLLLSTCSKNIAEMPDRNDMEVNVLKPPTQPSIGDGTATAPFEETPFIPTH